MSCSNVSRARSRTVSADGTVLVAVSLDFKH